jgi:hypothetical protein
MSAPIWITPAGLLGVAPVSINRNIPTTAEPVAPAVALTYKLISGSVPAGMTYQEIGLVTGAPAVESANTTSTFVVRVTDNLGNFADRTFSIQVSGVLVPTFTTPEGPILETFDSLWVEQAIEYSNPLSTNPVNIRVLQGELPPGLEINEFGLIRGYPQPPVTLVNLPEVTSVGTSTDFTTNTITVLSTTDFSINRPVVFTGAVLGGLVAGTVYYIKDIVNSTQFTISTIPGGDTFILNSDVGFMDVTLTAVTQGQPAKRQYNFTLILSSPLGNDLSQYNITVINQQLPISQGGQGKPPNTRNPVIFNTRPQTYDIEPLPDYRYYVLPPADTVAVPGNTYSPGSKAYIGQFISGNFLAFKILGYDFDQQELTYIFNEVPAGFTGDPNTGWIYGTPTVPLNTIEEFEFTVQVRKTVSLSFGSLTFRFSFRVANNIDGDITWLTDSDLGTIFNATESNKQISAISDVNLVYEKISGTLPPNLTFNNITGSIDGIVSYQPTTSYQEKPDTSVWTFTIKAYNPDILDDGQPLISSEKTFTLTVVQEYDIPTDNLYIKCTPSLQDRNIISSLLTNTTLIPDSYIYRPEDENYGKASSIIYAHAYGIYSSDIDEYLAAVKKNHYWRSIILGELKTAVAKDENGIPLYEVVYSTVIDNLQKYDPNYDYDYRYSESISEEIFWPRFIDLNLGPWYASSTEIYTSYIFNQEAKIITNYFEYDLLTQTGLPILMQQGVPTFYTSLTPGYARVLYPNSLENMRKRVEQELGVDFNFRLLPLWMTSQQADGNTLGFTPAWVIAYTKIPEPINVTAIATYNLTNEVELESVDNLIVGGKIVFSGDSIGSLNPDVVYYVNEINSVTNRIKLSNTQYGTNISLVSGTGSMSGVYDAVSYAEIIKYNIETQWQYTLNQINFQIDRFTVGKELTYDLSTEVTPSTWTRYPSGVPVPVPSDSKDFYVLFPRRTILPDKTQYNL